MQSPPSHSTQGFREFYETVGRCYPEEDLVYRTLRGMLRREFVLSQVKTFQGPFIDLGCNRGFYISQFRQGVAVGVDLALSVLRLAKQRNPKARWVQGDIQDLSFVRSQACNSVLCSEVIEHLPAADRLVAECYRILKRGGVCLITTPNYKHSKPEWVSVGVMKEFGVQGLHGDTYFHTAFRPRELREMAEAAGFRTLECGTLEKEVKYATRFPVVLFHLLRLANEHTINSAGFAQFNQVLLERSSLMVYKLCRALRLNGLFVGFIKEGVRSYLLAQKP